MASNVTRDHHRWTRDITVSKATPIAINLTDALNSTLTVSSDGVAAPILAISGLSQESTGSGILQFNTQRDPGTDAQAGDQIGIITFMGYDDGTPAEQQYGNINCRTDVVTSGEESGKLSLQVANHDGGLNDGLVLTGGSVDTEVDVTIGNGAASLTTIAGNLDIDGETITTAGDITLDSPADIILSADGDNIKMDDGTTTRFDFLLDSTPRLDITGAFALNGDGTVIIISGSHFSVDSTGSITLDSATGQFVAKNVGTEFSVADSAYAGMILGYTTVGIDATQDSVVVGSSFAVTDSAHKVTFVAPPSGTVEIEVNISAISTRVLQLIFGLSDDDTTYSPIDFPNADDVTNEHNIMDIQVEGFARVINHKWVVGGLTAGTSYTWNLGAKGEQASRITLWWGGTTSGRYPPFIMKATALPLATADYAVYG